MKQLVQHFRETDYLNQSIRVPASAATISAQYLSGKSALPRIAGMSRFSAIAHPWPTSHPQSTFDRQRVPRSSA
jgi:hypothetical protein